MHPRASDWFLPSLQHTRILWSHSNDGWLRLDLALDTGAVPPRRSLCGHSGEGALSWSERDARPLPDSTPREVRTSMRRLAALATEGVAAEDNPHEDTRGLEAVDVPALRYELPDPPAGPSSYLDISRTHDGVLLALPLSPDVTVYGLGEKTGGLDKRGRTWVMWNSDDPTHTPDKSALYQSQPVVYLRGREGTTTLFIDSYATVWFDAGEAEADRLFIEIYDGNFSCYLRHDGTLPEAVECYTALTGRMPLPPEWALGFQQCRYSYFPEERVMEVARRFREEEVPCDALYLDIHYMQGYRVFTWDRKRFPEPARMIGALRRAGFRVVTIVDPGVKQDPDYPVYASGLREDLFLRRSDGSVYTGRVWPGKAVFPDFFRPETMQWWAEWHRVLFEAGVAGIWNDMNEPADFSGDMNWRLNFTVPDDLVAGGDSGRSSFGVLHNGYANGMNAAARLAFERYRPEERGFVLTRAGAAGVQRHAAVWTGDNHSWWEHLAMMIPMFCNVGLSGAPFVGGDAGGFQLNADAELYSRWIAAAAFTPFFRAHSALDTRDHEPWSFGERALAIARFYIGLRYRLLPYIYTLFEEASRTGAPVMRPLVWEFPRDPRVASRADSFLLGEALLVAPLREAGVQERSVYLPAGIWYDFWTGERIEVEPGPEGTGRSVVAEAPLERLPLYVRGGRIIPFEGVRQHTGEEGDGILRFLVAPDGEGRARGSLYGDAGEGFGYQSGAFWRTSLSWAGGELAFERAGDSAGSAGGGAEHTRWSRYVVVSAEGAEAVEGALPVEGAVPAQRSVLDFQWHTRNPVSFRPG